MAYDNIYKKGSTSIIIQVMLRDATSGAGKTNVAYNGITAYYCRPGGTSQQITLIAGAPGAAYSSGKWAEIDATNQKGMYQLHVPDACLATGANVVDISIQGTGVIDARVKIVLIDSDLRDAVHLGITGIPNAVAGAAGGLVLNDGTTPYTQKQVYDKANGAATPGAKMDLVDAPNGTAVDALKDGLANMDVNLVQIEGVALAGFPGNVPAAFTKFFDVSEPVGTVNSLPAGAAGEQYGLPVLSQEMRLPETENTDTILDKFHFTGADGSEKVNADLGTVDGSYGVLAALKEILAKLTGDPTKVGDAYQYHDKASGALLFTLTINGTQVTRS
jgi:hypothetical protein